MKSGMESAALQTVEEPSSDSDSRMIASRFFISSGTSFFTEFHSFLILKLQVP